jgi:hydroxymethylpyrimidine pyrophosphatase-like HAD family hydrolase
MPLLSLEALVNDAPQIQLIASDVDGTLTCFDRFTPQLLEAIAQLAQANLPLLLVTGRSAGWVDALRNYLPVVGAIAENGGVFFPETGDYNLLGDFPKLALHRQQLADAFHQLQQQYPQLQASTDNVFRLTDWTFDVEGLSEGDLGAISLQCQTWGWSFTYSAVQCHIKPKLQNKAWGIGQVLTQHFPELHPSQVLTIGDSPNDEAMFDTDIFPISVGVSNILGYVDRLKHLPQYVTTQPEADGFCELVNHLLACVNQKGEAKRLPLF